MAIRRDAIGPLIEHDVHADFLLRRGWSVVARPRSEVSAVEARSEVAVAAKWAAQRRSLALSASAGPVWASAGMGGCAGWSAEGRLALGRGFDWGRASGFAEAVSGYRGGAGACGQAKLDINFGFRATPDYLWLGQGFFFADRHASDTFKVQASGVKVLRDGSGLQLGVRAVVDGGRFSDPALVIGFWRSADAR